MKQIQSFILAIVFFLMIGLSSFVVPIVKTQPQKNEYVSPVTQVIVKEVFVDPPHFTLPEVVIEERVKPRIIEVIKEIPTYVPGETVYRTLRAPILEKIHAEKYYLGIKESISDRSVASLNIRDKNLLAVQH